MGEIVEAMGITLQEEILSEIRDSPFYSIILVEATDIPMTKHLGICIQYLTKNATLQTSKTQGSSTLPANVYSTRPPFHNLQHHFIHTFQALSLPRPLRAWVQGYIFS